ncbi:MAG: beta-galactosidase [Halioglobus sp.]
MFGICYYPEHCSPSLWPQDAKMMVELGLDYVRIGEFAWSRMEPAPGDFRFEWLDEAIAVLSDAGLKVILCTPTATPPKWLVDQWPDILPVDPDTGQTRGFGSRRHYDFSSQNYLRESLRITEVLVKRYGQDDRIVGWQTDNELCCHDTTLSGSENAAQAFRQWCADRYGSIDALNTAWGTVFWSMEYRDFSEIDLPIGTVTEASPAHRLAYRRFSSDQVVNYHNQTVALIRDHAPGRFVTHNFIPIDHVGADSFALAQPLDFASYDNYPLGRTDIHFASASTEQFRKYMRTGHPDFATYYHDQTRSLTDGGFWVMEQQPGPVNWAENNPRPAPGMIRFWTLEAFAHGAECVCYFRWRQAAFGQEQMHAGLLRPDNSKSDAWVQAEQAKADIDQLSLLSHKMRPAPVAILTGVEGMWVSEIERQAQDYDYNSVQLSYYSALRELGVNVDFISVDSDFSHYFLIIAPCTPILDEAFVQKCRDASATFIFGPRAAAKTQEFGYPQNLPPGVLQELLPMKILSVETLRADCTESMTWENREYQSGIWREELEASDVQTLAKYEDGSPAVIQHERFIYMATLTDDQFLQDFFMAQCVTAGIKTYFFGPDIRVCQRGELMFAFNYSAQEHALPLDSDVEVLLGSLAIKPRDITVWRDA